MIGGIGPMQKQYATAQRRIAELEAIVAGQHAVLEGYRSLIPHLVDTTPPPPVPLPTAYPRTYQRRIELLAHLRDLDWCRPRDLGPDYRATTPDDLKILVNAGLVERRQTDDHLRYPLYDYHITPLGLATLVEEGKGHNGNGKGKGGA
jgi:hypothetical protein